MMPHSLNFTWPCQAGSRDKPIWRGVGLHANHIISCFELQGRGIMHFHDLIWEYLGTVPPCSQVKPIWHGVGLHTHRQHHWRRPMGMTGWPDIFQEKMSPQMETFEYVQMYIDDLLTITKGTYEDHLSKLGQVFTLLCMAGLRVNTNKRSFAQEEVEYLGYILPNLTHNDPCCDITSGADVYTLFGARGTKNAMAKGRAAEDRLRQEPPLGEGWDSRRAVEAFKISSRQAPSFC